MIQIYMDGSKIIVKGHAGFAPPGQDIVCAGISALTQTLVQALDVLAPGEAAFYIEPEKAAIQFQTHSEKEQAAGPLFFHWRGNDCPDIPGKRKPYLHRPGLDVMKSYGNLPKEDLETVKKQNMDLQLFAEEEPAAQESSTTEESQAAGSPEKAGDAALEAKLEQLLEQKFSQRMKAWEAGQQKRAEKPPSWQK